MTFHMNKYFDSEMECVDLTKAVITHLSSVGGLAFPEPIYFGSGKDFAHHLAWVGKNSPDVEVSVEEDGNFTTVCYDDSRLSLLVLFAKTKNGGEFAVLDVWVNDVLYAKVLEDFGMRFVRKFEEGEW